MHFTFYAIVTLLIGLTIRSTIIKFRYVYYNPLNCTSINMSLKMCLWIILWIFLIYVSVNKPDSIPDYAVYKEIFENIKDGIPIIYEPTFIWISRGVNDFTALLLIYAIIGIGLKLISIKQLSPDKTLSLLCYVSLTYILQDVVQIRAGIASAIFLISIYYLCGYKKNIYCTLILIASLFHFSSVILFCFVFFNQNKIDIQYWAWLLCAIFVMSLFNISLGSVLMKMPIDSLAIYKNYLNAENNMSVGLLLYVRIFIAFAILLNIYKIKRLFPCAIIYLKIYIVSILLLPLFNSLPFVGGRLNELVGVVEIVVVTFIPMISYRYKEFLKYGSILFCLLLFIMRGAILIQ